MPTEVTTRTNISHAMHSDPFFSGIALALALAFTLLTSVNV